MIHTKKNQLLLKLIIIQLAVFYLTVYFLVNLGIH